MSLDQGKVLSSWKRFIEITGCEKSKIPLSSINNCQNIVFKNTDFIENTKSNGVFIEITPSKIAQLKDKFVSYDIEKNAEVLTSPLSFAFPLLTINKSQQSFYLPLFTFELPADFLIQPNFSGFDLPTNLADQIKVNIAVLLNYLDIDNDDIDESRNFIDLVNVLCGTKHSTFKGVLNEFINWANNRLEEKNNNFKQIFIAPNTNGLILPSANDSSPSKDLEDFRFLENGISKSEENSKDYLVKYFPLVSSYLSKTAEQSILKTRKVHLTRTYGLFESEYSLGRGQYQSIQAANLDPRLPLIAVQGAPGTGKTTLFKSLIAQQVVARALSIISKNEKRFNMLVCSTAVKAVDNVIADLKADAFTKDLNWLWFHGGKKATVDNEVNERLNSHIADLEASEFDKNKYDSLLTDIISSQSKIEYISRQYLNEVDRLNKIKMEIPFEFENDNASSLLPTLQNLVRQQYPFLMPFFDVLKVGTESELNRFIISLNTEIKKTNNTINEINLAKDCVKSLLAYWPPKFTPSQFSDWMLNKKVRGSFSLNIGDFFRLQLIKIIALFSPAKINFASAYEILSRHDELDSLNAKSQLLNSQLAGSIQVHCNYKSILQYLKLKSLMEESYAGCTDLSDVLRLKAIKLNRKIFEDSIQFLYQEQLKRKFELIEVLNHWSALLSNSSGPSPHFGKYIKRSKEFFDLISLAYPVVASTLHSAYKMSGYKKLDHLKQTKPWNLVLIDEAGMVSVENLIPVLCRSNMAMLVGDPLQLEPIRTISKPSLKSIYNEFYANEDEEFIKLGPGQVTAYHRAAGTLSGAVNDIGDGIILDEHRRCQPPIAQLFIDIAQYKDLSIDTFKPKEKINNAFLALGGHNLMFYHVDGKRNNGKTNLEEVRAIGELLDQLEKAGYNLSNDVGIITPYADQKHLLIRAYGKRLGSGNEIRIGTVHQFQGTGFEVIIFSPVIFEENDSTSFQNSKPNMLNVAVSRAKQQFIVVGNYHKLTKNNGPLKILAERSASEFYLELGSQSPSFNELASGFNIERQIFDERHIEAFEYYLGICEESITIVVPWIRKPYRDPIQKQLDLITAAKQRGINITVYYGYSNIETNPAEDNDPLLVQQYKDILGEENVIRVPQGTHEKVLLVDDRVLVVGSWNWLSNAYYKWNQSKKENTPKLTIRRETSIIIKDRKTISDYKAHNLFDLN